MLELAMLASSLYLELALNHSLLLGSTQKTDGLAYKRDSLFSEFWSNSRATGLTSFKLIAGFMSIAASSSFTSI